MWDGERVSVVLNLVAALPESEGTRRFLPRYAIRLRGGPVVLTEVASCFQCHNAMSVPIADNTQPPTWFTLDPDSKPAQNLMHLLQSCAEQATATVATSAEHTVGVMSMRRMGSRHRLHTG